MRRFCTAALSAIASGPTVVPGASEVKMKKVVLPRDRGQNALALLLSGRRFEVLAQATHGEPDFAAFVLGRFGWSWGHFYRAAFCSFSASGEDELTLEISHLDVQRQWFGRNLFRDADRGIEEDIADYALVNIHGSRPL